MQEQNMVPVTILTGFLGSGKTTLLNRILREDHGQRIAVIENEFGEVGVDSDLIEKGDEEIVKMNNGCTCCSALPRARRSRRCTSATRRSRRCSTSAAST